MVRDMAQQAKALGTNPDGLSVIPRTHIVERMN